MRGKSHHCLGQFLIEAYMPELPRQYRRAFLFGCVEPDRNPLTYLKGSLRCQWLRGHNYRNARRFMRLLSHRLERKERWKLADYYALGKLMHYTADAFTYAHNEHFPRDLEQHRAYEAQLQEHFLKYLAQDPVIDLNAARSVVDVISTYHRDYVSQQPCISRDAHYALSACCCMLAAVLTGRIL